MKEVTRDVKERGRDIDGCIKQWINFVKPNFEQYVQPQRKRAGRVASSSFANKESGQVTKSALDIIVPRGMQNRVAIDMIVRHIQRTLAEKSKMHREALHRLGQEVEDEPLSSNVLLVEQTKQFVGMSTILQNPATDDVDFVFYFDRTATFLIERQVLQVRPRNTGFSSDEA